MPSDDDLFEVFAVDEEADEPQPDYGDFWEQAPEDGAEEEP
ncbi:MAG: hypothetical protein ABR915_09030 [Thermoguttaceae bacterium]|jgi:hypothetical protein